MGPVQSEFSYEETVLQRNFTKITFLGKFHGKKKLELQYNLYYISEIYAVTRWAIKGLYSACWYTL